MRYLIHISHPRNTNSTLDGFVKEGSLQDALLITNNIEKAKNFKGLTTCIVEKEKIEADSGFQCKVSILVELS